MDWYEFYEAVVEQAVLLGYSEQQVNMFIGDIKHHYDNGLSVDEVINIEF